MIDRQFLVAREVAETRRIDGNYRSII